MRIVKKRWWHVEREFRQDEVNCTMGPNPILWSRIRNFHTSAIWQDIFSKFRLNLANKISRETVDTKQFQMPLLNYFCPIVNWYFGVATPPYTPAVFCFCCHNFFYIATFILYNGWGDFLVQTKLLKQHIVGRILWCNFLCKLDRKYCWKILLHKLNTVW